jgi:tRNA(Ile)-lysidine synthetase-like protein
MRLAPTLRRRVLWRLLVEGTGRAPTQTLLKAVLADLGAARCTRHSLPGGWTLVLRSKDLSLLPPVQQLPPNPILQQTMLPFPEGAGACDALDIVEVPGITTLPDGRRISAERIERPPGSPVTGAPLQVELDADRLPARLLLRRPRRGDRFHPLGGPGSRPLRRFLADQGVPREERDRILLVEAAGEIVWVVGIRPSELARVSPKTRARLVLTLHHPGLPPAQPPPPAPQDGPLDLR